MHDGKPSHVFVTGGTGNVGGGVVAELLARDSKVTALVRSKTDALKCTTVIGHLREIHALQEVISECDSIVHLASSRSNDPVQVIEEDYWGTLQLLSMWARGHFIYSSTQTVYGAPRATLTEETPYAPEAWYDLGNIFAEQTLSMLSKQRPQCVGISLRLAVLWPRGGRAMDRQFFSDVASHCDRDGRFYVDSEAGLETYGTSLLGAHDMARAIVDSMKLKDSGAYNVAGPFVTWRELIDVYNRFAGTRASVVVARNEKEASGAMRLPCTRSLLDDQKFRRATGFAHQRSLEDLISDFVTNRQGQKQ